MDGWGSYNCNVSRRNNSFSYLPLAFEPEMSCCPFPGIHRNTGGSSVHTRYLWAGWKGWCCARKVNWCPEGASCPRWAGRTDGTPGRTGTDGPPWKSATWKVWAIHLIATISLKEAKAGGENYSRSRTPGRRLPRAWVGHAAEQPPLRAPSAPACGRPPDR